MEDIDKKSVSKYSSDAANCLVCGNDARVIWKIQNHWIYDCTVCSHRHTKIEDLCVHVENTYGDSYFTEGAAGYADYVAESEMLIEHGRRYAQILRKCIPRSGILLDVGSAAGFILKGFVDLGWLGLGIEPNEKMARYAREVLNLDVICGTIETCKLARNVDLITMIQVVAHLVDPNSVIAKCRTLLNPGGYVLVETWDYRSITARVFGRRWHEYSPPSVLHWFSRNSLDVLMINNGFERIAQGRPKKFISAGHAKSLLKYKSNVSNIMKLLHAVSSWVPDRMRLRYPAYDLIWSLYRLS